MGVRVGGGTPAILRVNRLSHSKAQESWSDESSQKETENAIQGRTAASANVRCPDVFSCWNINRQKAQRFLKEKTKKSSPGYEPQFVGEYEQLHMIKGPLICEGQPKYTLVSTHVRKILSVFSKEGLGGGGFKVASMCQTGEEDRKEKIVI